MRADKWFWYLIKSISPSEQPPKDNRSGSDLIEELKKSRRRPIVTVNTTSFLQGSSTTDEPVSSNQIQRVGHCNVDPFGSIGELVHALHTRPRQKHAGYSSDKADIDNWFLTKNYAEAEKLLLYGYEDVIKRISKEVPKIADLFKNQYVPTNRSYTRVEGFQVHVPNALMNLPQSMVGEIHKRIVHKTLTILYDCGGCWAIEGKELLRAGIVLLGVIQALELQRISVRLVVLEGNEDVGRNTDNLRRYSCLYLVLKDFNERLNLSKISFPIANPSMLRRIGFRWEETYPLEFSSGFFYGYGCPMPISALRETFKKEGIVITARDIIGMGYSPHTLIKHLKNYV